MLLTALTRFSFPVWQRGVLDLSVFLPLIVVAGSSVSWLKGGSRGQVVAYDRFFHMGFRNTERMIRTRKNLYISICTRRFNRRLLHASQRMADSRILPIRSREGKSASCANVELILLRQPLLFQPAQELHLKRREALEPAEKWRTLGVLHLRVLAEPWLLFQMILDATGRRNRRCAPSRSEVFPSRSTEESAPIQREELMTAGLPRP